MAIITVSRGSFTRGKEVAEKVADKLGYECISRDVLLEACREFNVPELKLVRAIQNAPSILERLTGGKKRFLAYFQAVLLDHFQRDNVVYHGLAGHFFVAGVAHVLKVRVIAEMEDRARAEMRREGISESEALRILQSDDEERRKWSRDLFGIDTSDPTLYDLVIHIKKLTPDDAVELICHLAGLEAFRTTAESQRAMDDLTISAKVKAALIVLKPEVQVACEDGSVRVEIKTSHLPEESRLISLAREVPGVKEVEIRAQELKVT